MAGRIVYCNMVWLGDVCQVFPNRTLDFNNNAFTSPVSGFIVVADRPTTTLLTVNIVIVPEDHLHMIPL